MVARFAVGLLFVASASAQIRAQGKPQVDWEAKALVMELQRYGDPEINLLLPELYKALASSRVDMENAETGREAFTKQRMKADPSLMSLLINPSVRSEIEMLESQYEDLQERNRSIQSATNEQVFALLLNARDGSVDPQAVRERLREIRENAVKEVEKTILPFQVDRLRQVAIHVQMRQSGVLPVLLRDPLAAELNITEEQRETLTEAAKEIEEEVAREIAELRAKARQKLFSRLQQDQQKTLSQIIGDDFDYQAMDKSQEIGSRGKSPKPAPAKK